MFEGVKEILDKYYKFLKDKFGENIGIMYGLYTGDDGIEVDLMLGEDSELVHGVRFFNTGKGIIYDLLANSKEKSKENLTLDDKQKKKILGKEAYSFHAENESFKIDHNFVFYSKNGSLKKDIKYVEMIPVHPSEEFRLKTFSLDKELFEMQVQA